MSLYSESWVLARKLGTSLWIGNQLGGFFGYAQLLEALCNEGAFARIGCPNHCYSEIVDEGVLNGLQDVQVRSSRTRLVEAYSSGCGTRESTRTIANVR